METTVLIDKINEILEGVLPVGAEKIVKEYRILGEDNIKIALRVPGSDKDCFCPQNPHIVSFTLNPVSFELGDQIFGGYGGKSFYFKANKDTEVEKIKLSFRKPRKTEKAVLNAVKSFSERWVKELKERNVL